MSYTKLAIRLLAVFTIIHAPCAVGDGVSEAQKAAIRSKIDDVLTHEGIPGASVAVVVNGEMAWAEGRGLADLDKKRAASADTVYRLASVSKPITTIAALQLVDEGRLDLHVPVQTYLPDFPEKPWPITLHHLLSHQSGIRHWQGAEEIKNTHRYPDIASTLGGFQDDPLLFEPGTKDEYSTPAFNVVGRIIEAVTGSRFENHLKSAVIEPSGAKHVYAATDIPKRTDIAERYRDTRRGPVPAPAHDVSIKIPGGGLAGSAEDVGRIVAALLDGKLLQPETMELMFAAKTLTDGTVTNKGYGCNVGAEKDRDVAWHIGGLVGASGIVYMYPEKKHAVVLLTNRRASPVFPLASEIMDVVVGL